MFSARFIQKTIKVDLYVRINRAYSWRKQHQKDLEDTRGHCAKAERRRLPGGAGHMPVGPWAHMLASHCYAGSPLP